jgi:hypothetical protein
MKKTGIVVFCLFLLFVLVFAGSASAYNADYTKIDYYSGEIKPTIDGTYIVDEEWVSSQGQTFGTNGIFRDEWCTPEGLGGVTWACFLIETADATDDAEDYWVMCFDSTEAGTDTDPDGGAAPQTNDYKFVVTGHGATATVQWYKGTGTGWDPVTSPDENVFQQAQSLTATPMIDTSHYVLEACVEKQDTATYGTVIMGYNWAMYVAYYDAHEGGDGLQQWPPEPASADVPDSWGYVAYAFEANSEPDIPENMSFVVMLALSSVAATVAVLLRKRKK